MFSTGPFALAAERHAAPRMRRRWTLSLRNSLHAIEWSSDGKLVALTGRGEAVVLGDGGRAVWRRPGAARCAAWSHDGSVLALAQEKTIDLRAAADGALLAVCECEQPIRQLAWHPRSDVLAVSVARAIRFWRSDGLHLHDHPVDVPPNGIAWHPSSDRLAFSSTAGVRILPTGPGVRSFRLASHRAFGELRWSPKGRRLLALAGDGSLVMFDLVRARTLEVRGELCPVRGGVFNPGGQLLATASISQLSVWRIDAPRSEQPIVIAGTGPELTGFSFSTRDELATSAVDGTVCVWSLFRPDAPLGSERLSAPAIACTWSPDGGTLAAASGNTVSAFAF